MKLCKKSAIIGFAIGAVVASAIIFIFFNQTKEYAYVNIDKVISYVMSQVNKGNSSEMVTEEVENYKRLFVKTLDEYAKSNNTIIFSSPKPISGAEDVTDLLIKKAFDKQTLTKESMGGKGSD